MNEFFGSTTRRFTNGTGSDNSDHEHFPTCFDISAPPNVHDPVDFGMHDTRDRQLPPIPSAVPPDIDKVVDSAILQMLQFHDAADIQEALLKRPKPSPESICIRIEQLLYTAHEAVEALESTQKTRFRRRKPAIAPLERYIMLYLKTHFHERPFESVLQEWRYLFWGGHKVEELVEAYKEICELDIHGETRIIDELASTLALAESENVGSGFQATETHRAGVTNEDMEWWRAWIGYSLAAPDIPKEPPHVDVRHVDINRLEAELEFLSWKEGNKESPWLAMLECDGLSWRVEQKVSLIGERDRNSNVELNLLDVRGFEKLREEFLVVLELKSDLWFYVENIGEATFRVNGIEIPPGKATYLNNFAFLEFSNVGMIFRINSFQWAELLRCVKKAEAVAKAAENMEEEDEIDTNDLIGPGTSDDEDDNEMDEPVLSSD